MKKNLESIISYFQPHLSRERVADRNNIGDAHQFRYGGKKIIIHKTVQHWFEDVKYNDSLVKYYLSDSKSPHSKVTFDDVSLAVLDGYDKYTVEDSVMFKITKRFELATQMVIQNVFSSSRYQVRDTSTNKVARHLKISQIIVSCPLADCFEFRTCMADRYL